jgi:hypothetical protein
VIFHCTTNIVVISILLILRDFSSSAAQEKVLLELSSTTFKLLKTFLIDSELNSVLSILKAEFIVQTEKRRGNVLIAAFKLHFQHSYKGSACHLLISDPFYIYLYSTLLFMYHILPRYCQVPVFHETHLSLGMEAVTNEKRSLL